MKLKFTTLFVLFITGITTLYAKKDTLCITLRPSNASSAVISTQAPNTSNGTDVDFFSATWTCGSPCLDRALITFNLASIPPAATILNATLSLYVDNNSAVGVNGSPTYGSNNAGWLMRVTSPWAYNTVTWNSQPTTTGVDEVTLTQSINTSENYTLNVAQLVTDILNSGNNYGFMLMQQNEATPYQSLIFGSCINADTNLHPKLQVCYVIDSNIVPDSLTCVTFRPAAASSAVISTQAPNASNGNDVDFFSATWTCGSPCLDRGLITFNLASIPPSATVVNATLSLYVDNNSAVGVNGSPTYGSNNAAWLMRVTSPWTYNTVTWNSQPTTTAVDEVTLAQSINTSENYTLNVAQLVTDILNSGNNYGFMLMQQNEATPYQSLIFGSCANVDTNLHPKLQVCYKLPAGINTPKTSALIDVYPNPATDKIVFKTVISQDMDDYFVELYNAFGQKIKIVKLYPYETTISTSDLPRGLYLYRIMGKKTLLKSGKIELQ